MRADTRSGLVIALVQFLFATTWIVYAIYLKELMQRVGLDPGLFLWVILVDQLVFMVSDTAMGYAADRVERALGRIGPFLVGVSALSCALFIALPLLADTDLPGRGGLFLALVLLWVGTSSVLRAPPLVLLTKYAALPRTPWLAALVLFGLALSGSASPYLGELLKGLDPLVPFAVTGLTLVATTVPLIWLERRRPEAESVPVPLGRPDGAATMALLAGALFVGMGFQLHAFLNSSSLFLRFAGSETLVWLLPLFWVGFKLAVFPGAWAARRLGPNQVLMAAALIGCVALWGSSRAGGLAALMAWQMLAGAAWGVLFVSGISTALGLGRTGREGLTLGLWFSMLSLAALLRLAFAVGGVLGQPQAQVWLPHAAWGLWAVGLVPLLYLTLRTGHRPSSGDSVTH